MNPSEFRGKQLIDALSDRTFQVLFLGFASLMSFLGRMAWGGIRPDADAWYGQKAKEMLDFHSPFIVTYNGEPAFEHVPFGIWVEALSFRLFGVSSYTAVLPSALWSTGTVFLTYAIGRRFFNSRWVGFVAGMILVFPGYFMENARRGHLDATFAFLVTLALYAFLRGQRQPRWYLLYGLATGCAVLTKSLLGLFPYVIGLAYLILTRQFRRIFHPWLVFSVTLGTVLGFSWYAVNWQEFGDAFYDVHFSHQIMGYYEGENKSWRTYLYYPKKLGGNYWPWLPLMIWGLWYFFKRVFRERDPVCLFVLVWLFAFYGILGSSRVQQLQYFISVFPALALIVAKTAGDLAPDVWKRRLAVFLAGGLLVSVFLVNATGIEIRKSSSLRQKSRWTRNLAAVINLNTRPGEILGNLRFTSPEEPKTGLLFYADRFLEPPIQEYGDFMAALEGHPEKKWIVPIEDFRKLNQEYPGKIFLIQGNAWYGFVTSIQNRDNIRYDFSRPGLTTVQ